MSPLPVIQTVLLTFAAIQRYWSSLLVGLVIPAACISAIEIATLDLPVNFLYAIAVWVLSAPFYALFAIVCHRTVILGNESLPNRFGVFWSNRELKFVGWTAALFVLLIVAAFFVGIMLAAIGPLIPPGPLPLLVLLAVWFGFAYLYARLSMLFPATAIDERTDFERAWQLTEGNGLRVVAVGLLTAGPIGLLFLGFVYYMPEGLVPSVIVELLRHVLMMVAVVAISVTYRQLIRIEHDRFGGLPSSAPSDATDEPPGKSSDD